MPGTQQALYEWSHYKLGMPRTLSRIGHILENHTADINPFPGIELPMQQVWIDNYHIHGDFSYIYIYTHTHKVCALLSSLITSCNITMLEYVHMKIIISL